MTLTLVPSDVIAQGAGRSAELTVWFRFQGKFTFTNGQSIEREFVDDHMVEVPQAGPTSHNPHQRTPCGELHGDL